MGFVSRSTIALVNRVFWVLCVGLLEVACQAGSSPVVRMAVDELSGSQGDLLRALLGTDAQLEATTNRSDLDVFTPENLTFSSQGAPRAEKDLRTLLSRNDWGKFAPAVADPNLTSDAVVRELAGSLTVTHVWYVNLALLAQLGLEPARSYDELKQQVPRLREKGLDVVVMGNGEPGILSTCLFSTLLGRFGGARMSFELASGTLKFTDKRFLSALTFVQTLFADGVLSKSTLSTAYADVPKLFAQGKAPYCIDGDWRATAWERDPAQGSALLSPIEQVTIQMSSFPILPGELAGSPRSSIQLGKGYALSASLPAGSTQEAAALRVLLALEGPEVQRARWGQGVFPSRIDALGTDLEPLTRSRRSLHAHITGTRPLESLLSPPVREALNAALIDLAWATTTPSGAAERIQRAWDEARNSAEAPRPH